MSIMKAIKTFSIDWELSIKLAAGKKELAEEMLAMFVADLPNSLHKIQEAYKAQNLTELQMQVHKLHGASCYCGVPQLKVILADTERMLKSSNTQLLVAMMKLIEHEANEIIACYHEGTFKHS